jgi:hypothetical protein
MPDHNGQQLAYVLHRREELIKSERGRLAKAEWTWPTKMTVYAPGFSRRFPVLIRGLKSGHSRQKFLNRVGDSSVYLTVCWIFR